MVVYHVLLTFDLNASENKFSVEVLALGVDVFFVISGFIIYLSTKEEKLSPYVWWRGRLIRIVPLYWLTLILALGLGLLNGVPSRNFSEIISAFAFIPYTNSSTGDFTPFFVPGWTLNYEFYFYAIVAVTLLLPRQFRFITVAGVFGFAVSMRMFADPTSAIQVRMTSPLVFEFVGGMALAAVRHKLPVNYVALLVGLTFFVCAVVFLYFVSSVMYRHGPRTIYGGVPALLVVGAVVAIEPQLRYRILRLFKALGDSSYSLYLFHVLLLDAIGMIASHWSRSILCVVVLSSSCILGGWYMHKLVELPLLGYFRRKLQVSKPNRLPLS